MNKTEKGILKSAVENIFSGSERKEKEEISVFRTRMETSAKDGCHTIMRLIESDEGNKTIIMNTLIWLEANSMLDEDWTFNDIVTKMKNTGFNGD